MISVVNVVDRVTRPGTGPALGYPARADGLVEHGEGLSDPQWGGWLVGGHQRPEEPVVNLGVEDGEPLPVVGET